MAKYWMIHPELFNADKYGKVFPAVVVKPNPHYRYQDDPEYIEIDVPDLPAPTGENDQ